MDAETTLARGRRLMTIGTAASVAIPLLLAPVWGRKYPVSDFSVAALVQVVPGLLTSWAAFGYQSAIQTPAQERDALDLTVLALSVTLVIGALAALGVFAFGGDLASWLRSPSVRGWLWAVPVLVIANSTRLVVDQWMIRRGLLGELGIAMLVSTVATACFTATGLWFPDATNFVLVGLVGGTVVGAIWRLARSQVWIAIRDYRPTASRLRSAAAVYGNFPRDVVPGSVLTNFGLQLPQVFLSRYFDAEITGQYARASVLVGVPASVLGQPIAATLATEAGRAFRERGDCRREVLRALGRLTWTLLPAYVLLAATAPVLFPLFLGPAWVPAGQLAQPMVASMVGAAVGGPLGIVLLIANRTGVNFLWQAGWLASVYAALSIGVRLGDPRAALWTLAAGNVLAYALYALLAIRYSRAASAPTPQR